MSLRKFRKASLLDKHEAEAEREKIELGEQKVAKIIKKAAKKK